MVQFSITLQRELVQCGKPRCEKLHGPYWYGYTTVDNRTRTVYVGRELDKAKAEQRMRELLGVRR